MDDKMLRLMFDTFTDAMPVQQLASVNPDCVESALALVLARIRRPLEARGIGLAAEWADKNGRPVSADYLRTLARQHAAGEDQS